MRILAFGDYCELGEMYRRLEEEGHEVRVWAKNAATMQVWAGLLTFVPDWKEALAWVKDAGGEGVLIFETSNGGTLQDELRANGYNVIGGSAYGDRLENDREFGQAALREIGLKTAHSFAFTSYAEGIDFVRAHPRRYVLKHNGATVVRSSNYVGQLKNGADVIAMLDFYRAHQPSERAVDFLLMDHVEGIEVGVGAYFNGRTFLKPACLDWEHKHFFPSELGELTGEMGTVVTFDNSEALFSSTLAKMEKRLASCGHCGYINLNLIVNEEGVWPLEFTSRFGYPGYAICEALQNISWSHLFRAILSKKESFPVRPGWAVGVVLTVPPFPYKYGYADLSKGLPVVLSKEFSAEERARIHLGDVALVNGVLVMSGETGYVGVVTGIGAKVEEAKISALELAQHIIVPNIRYRTDIGDRVTDQSLDQLDRWIFR